jgi:hypothetical protein
VKSKQFGNWNLLILTNLYLKSSSLWKYWTKRYRIKINQTKYPSIYDNKACMVFSDNSPLSSLRREYSLRKSPRCMCAHAPFQNLMQLKEFSSRLQTGFGAHPSSYPMGTGAFSPAVKQSRPEADHSPRTSAEVKKTWAYTSTPPSSWRSAWLVKHRDNFTLPLPSSSPSLNTF